MLTKLLLLSIISAISSRKHIDFSLKSYTNPPTTFTILDFSTASPILKWLNWQNSSIVRGNIALPNTIPNHLLLQFHEFQSKFIAIDLDSPHLTVTTDEYRFKLASSTRDLLEQHVSLNNSCCTCVHSNCACCLRSPIPQFKHSVCVNATYNNQTIGLDLSIGIDGHYFTEHISIRNPPPICFSVPIPSAEHIAGACVAFTDLDLNRKSKILSGCVEFEVEIVHLRLLHFKIGCFRMPI